MIVRLNGFMRSLPLWTLSFAVLPLIAGCGAATAPPLKDVPASTDLKVYSADKYGISIGIAPNFKVGSGHMSVPAASVGSMGNLPDGQPMPPMAGDLGKTLGGMAKQDEEEEKQRLAKMDSDGIIIRAFLPGGTTNGEDMTKYEVRISPNTSSNLAGAANSVLEHVPGEEPPVAMTLPIGPAMHIVTHKKMTDGGEVYSSKYVLQDGKTMIVVLFLTEGDPTSVSVVEKRVMDTLRVVPGKAVPPKDA
jgi:hypothetical protein